MFVVETYHQVVNPFIVVSLFGRGGFGLLVAPSLVEVEVVVYSLLVRWSWCWFCIPLGEVDCGCLVKGLPLLMRW